MHAMHHNGPLTQVYSMKDNIQLLKIPPGVKDSILPSKNLSIMDFLQFSLPGITCKSISLLIGQQKSFFLTLYLTITDPEVIKRLPLPPLSIL